MSAPPDSPASQAPHPQRLHDLRGAHADFKAVLRLLQNGYRFDDSDAPAALAQLAKAVDLLGREILTLEKDWKPG